MSEIKEPKVSYDACFQSADEKELPIKGNGKSSSDLKTSTPSSMSEDTTEVDKKPNLLTKGKDNEVVNATLPKTSALSSETVTQESIRNTGSEVLPGATTAVIDPETVVTRVSDDVPINSLSDPPCTVSLTNENPSSPPSAQVVDSVTNTMVVDTISSEAGATPTTAMVGQMTVLDSTESAASGTSMVLSQIPVEAGGHSVDTKPSKVTTIDNVTAKPADNIAVHSSNDNSNIINNTTTTTTTTTATTATTTTNNNNNTNKSCPTSANGTVASSAIPNHSGSSDGSSPTARISSPATGAAATITTSTTASPSGTPPLNNSGSSCGVGNTNNGSTPSSGGTHSPPNPQHVVLVHIQLGEIFAVRVGDQVQHIRGPATVRMVSSNGPPLPMPMQVAPGHMVQQIVDEHGILTNVILAPQMPGMPPGTPMTVGYYGGPNNAPHYYNPYSSHFPTPHPQYQPHHHGHHGAASHMHPGVTGHPHMHGTPPPHTCNSLAPPVHAAGPSPPINSVEERNRQRSWHGKSKSRKPEEGYYYRAPPRRNKSNKSTNSAVTISVNGDVHHQNNMATNTTISSTENGAEQEEERKMLQQPMSILHESKFTEEILKQIVPQCQVKEVESRSASIDLTPPDCGENEYDFIFELLLSEKGRESKYKLVYTGVSRVINLKDLKPACEYFLRACTKIEDFKGNLSEPISFKTLPCEPDPPQHPRLSSKSKTGLVLKWNAACENGSKISTYSLEYDQGLNNGQFVEVYNGLLKQARIQQLQAGTKYTFRLAAINNNGKSRFSEPVSFHTSGCAPSQPEHPKLDKAFINSLVLSWVKRTNDETFVLQMEDESTGYGFRITYNGPNTSYQVVELRRNTEYKFRLAAKNDEGQSKWSDIVSYCTLPEPPLPPSKLQVKGKIHACYFKITWDPPKDDGGSNISSYHVEIDDGSGFHNIYKGLDTECTCDGLTPGHTYKVQVGCSGPGGKSEFSEICIVTTTPVVPGPCQAPKLQGKPKAKSLNLRWGIPANDGGSAVTEYIVQMVSPDNSTREVYRGRDTECVVAGLLPGRPYLFQVRCANKIGAGPWSESLEVVSGPGVPDAPKLPTATCKSPHCIQVNWEKPVNNGATITDYRLEWQHKEDADFTQLHVGPQRKFEAKNLTPATKYSFRVLAINSAGPSPYSPVCQCQTTPSSPAAVVHYRVHSTATDILLKWEEPHSNGSEINSYNIDIGDKSLINISSASEYRISNLLPDTAYRIRIQAVNAIGPGAFSTPIKVVTKSLPPPPPSLECVSIAHNSLKLKWGDGRNPDLINYQLELGKDDKNFQLVYSGSAHVHKVGKLSELTSYDFRILAVNEAGCGEYSNIYKFSTTKAPPPPLKAPKVSEITINSCMVEWQGCKQMGVDSVIYQLQILCIGKGEHEYKSVYRGPETSFSVQNLSSRCDYQMRVGAIRICSDGLPDVTGAFSPGMPFTTLSPEPVRAVESRPPTVMKVPKSKPLTDQQISILFLFGFGVIAMILAVVAQYLLAYISGEG